MAPESIWDQCASTVQQPISEHLIQGFIHGLCCAAIHALDDVAVGVQRLRYGGVPYRSSWTYLGWTLPLSSSVAQVWCRS
jgi:hypothetical protein